MCSVLVGCIQDITSDITYLVVVNKKNNAMM